MLCPLCQHPVAPSGIVSIDGHELTVYQCDRCTVPWTVEGVTFPTALTFAVTADSVYLDPETSQPLVLN